MNGDFIWRDAGRTVVFRHNGVAQAPQLLREHGFSPFELLEHAAGAGRRRRAGPAATAVHEVGPGQVPDLAAALLDAVDSPELVALGGGRPIDVAKAVASVSGARVAAIPTTMSGAEMTGIHRLPAGAESRVGGMVRPALVIADPEAMTASPRTELRASSMNALAHGVDSLYTPFSNPVSQTAALRGSELIAAPSTRPPEERDPAALALGSMLCGYAIDSGSFGLHHVVCQTLVRSAAEPTPAPTRPTRRRRWLWPVEPGSSPARFPRWRGNRQGTRRYLSSARSSSPAIRPGRSLLCRRSPTLGEGALLDLAPPRARFHP